MFYVTRWDTGEVIYEFTKLATARRYARGLGHTGEDDPKLTGYPPIVFVANEKGECVYNPRFAKSVSPAVSGWMNLQNADSF